MAGGFNELYAACLIVLPCSLTAPSLPVQPVLLAGEPLPVLELGAVRGVKGIKEATVKLPVNPTTLKAGTAGKEVGAAPARCSAARILASVSCADFVALSRKPSCRDRLHPEPRQPLFC